MSENIRGTIQEVERSTVKLCFEWRVEGFLSLTHLDYICSPNISFEDASWYLQVDPSCEYLDLCFCRWDGGSPGTLNIAVSVMGPIREELKEERKWDFSQWNLWIQLFYGDSSVKIADPGRCLLQDGALVLRCKMETEAGGPAVVPQYYGMPSCSRFPTPGMVQGSQGQNPNTQQQLLRGGSTRPMTPQGPGAMAQGGGAMPQGMKRPGGQYQVVAPSYYENGSVKMGNARGMGTAMGLVPVLVNRAAAPNNNPDTMGSGGLRLLGSQAQQNPVASLFNSRTPNSNSIYTSPASSNVTFSQPNSGLGFSGTNGSQLGYGSGLRIGTAQPRSTMGYGSSSMGPIAASLSAIGTNDATTLAESQSSVKEAMEELHSSLRRLYESGEGCDVVMKVQDKEFPAHKLILQMRSPVFQAMFTHDMLEKQLNTVHIEDLDQGSFPSFLEHIYTGSVAMISTSNVFSLFRAADKYDLRSLKKECSQFMRRNMTVTSFCDVIRIAVKHDEKELIEHATEFFCGNSLVIVKTPDWQIFLDENPTVGNELVIKAFSNYENIIGGTK